VRTPEGKKTTVLLHSLLLPDAKMVDHKNQNGLDNQRVNLRPATGTQNQGNRRKNKNGVTSAYRGVSWQKDREKFYAQITFNGKVHNLGRFTNQQHAAIAYDKAAVQHFGEFARLNFPAQQLLKAA
jgi:hypothetical protein